jgi:hypothetical protein
VPLSATSKVDGVGSQEGARQPKWPGHGPTSVCTLTSGGLPRYTVRCQTQHIPMNMIQKDIYHMISQGIKYSTVEGYEEADGLPRSASMRSLHNREIQNSG